MTAPRPRALDTRGDKVWALDIAISMLWSRLWHMRDGRLPNTPNLTEEEMKRAMGILNRMSNGLAAQRGRLHRAGRKAQP